MNLGGPDRLENVQPFLFNLFSDPAIIRLPAVLRLPLAKLISWRRARVARNIYSRLGGGSPLLTNTEAQARALELMLGSDHRCFIAMRYWYPSSVETAREVAERSRRAVAEAHRKRRERLRRAVEPDDDDEQDRQQPAARGIAGQDHHRLVTA